jgi:ABC-type transporter Mla subunit MlaD
VVKEYLEPLQALLHGAKRLNKLSQTLELNGTNVERIQQVGKGLNQTNKQQFVMYRFGVTARRTCTHSKLSFREDILESFSELTPAH